MNLSKTRTQNIYKEYVTPKKDEIEEKIKEINPLEMTPMEALTFLYELNKEVKSKNK